MAIMLMQKVVSAMSTIQSDSSPIESAARAHSNLFTVYVIVLVVSGIVAAILTVLVWRASNRQQDAVQAFADARIAEANERGDTAIKEAKRIESEGKERVAQIESDAAKVKLESDEKIAALNKQSESLRAEAEKAREGIATAQNEAARANERAQEIERQNLALQKQIEDERRSNLELQLAIAPRIIEQFAGIIHMKPFAGMNVIVEAQNDVETIRTANQIVGMLRNAGWKVIRYAISSDNSEFFFPNIKIIHNVGPRMSEGMTRDAVDALLAELKANNIEASMFPAHPELPINTIRIRIGYNERPYFMEKWLDFIKKGRQER
jgi:outer membrane murein-binding lipoprotein Lpp